MFMMYSYLYETILDDVLYIRDCFEDRLVRLTGGKTLVLKNHSLAQVTQIQPRISNIL